MDRKLQIVFIILVFCETVKMDIEPCANSMWMERVIRDCYAGQAKKNRRAGTSIITDDA